MPRVVPSQVVAFIDQVFGWAANQELNHGVNLTRQNAGQLAGLIHLVDQIPEELLTINGGEYSSYVCSVAALSERLDLWRAQAPPPELELVFVSGLHQLSPVRLIRDALSVCPDASAAPTTSALNFMTHAQLRTDLRCDIGAIDRALSNGEWKAATVLAGSVIEALLLWALQQRLPADITTAVTTLRNSGELTRQPDPNLERWDLHEYTEVAAHVGIIQT